MKNKLVAVICLVLLATSCAFAAQADTYTSPPFTLKDSVALISDGTPNSKTDALGSKLRSADNVLNALPKDVRGIAKDRLGETVKLRWTGTISIQSYKESYGSYTTAKAVSGATAGKKYCALLVLWKGNGDRAWYTLSANCAEAGKVRCALGKNALTALNGTTGLLIILSN